MNNNYSKKRSAKYKQNVLIIKKIRHDETILLM